MSIGSRPILLLLAGILFSFACVPERTRPAFTFSNHAIKLHYDPVSQELTAVDTLSIQYEKNVDQIYFFLHESLHVERVSVGHQEFSIGEMNSEQVDDICRSLSEEWRQLMQDAQIVAVHIPKSLYSNILEIRYKGTINLMTKDRIVWHPVLPGVDSTFRLTTILPHEYVLETDGKLISEKEDELWRLSRFDIDNKQSCCGVRVRENVL
jgi:hypothetical protein